MKSLITDNFVINYQTELDEFIQDALAIFNQQVTSILDIFGELPKQKITASFFVERDAFVDYIKKITNGSIPPAWAIGCFYNGEIQTLININNKASLNSKKHILTHEFVHLCINNAIYDRYGIDRIRWLDESFAGYLDGHTDTITPDKLQAVVHSLEELENFDVNVLNDPNKIKTETYNGYDIFVIIGKYIFKNNLAKDYLEKLKNNPAQIINLGKNILGTAIDYVKSTVSN